MTRNVRCAIDAALRSAHASGTLTVDSPSRADAMHWPAGDTPELEECPEGGRPQAQEIRPMLRSKAEQVPGQT